MKVIGINNNLFKFIIMNREQVLGILRHVLTGLGGLLVERGLTDDTMLTEATGAIITLIGFVWSITSKMKNN